MDYKTLRKRALIFDFVAIAVAGACFTQGRVCLCQVGCWCLAL